MQKKRSFVLLIGNRILFNNFDIQLQYDVFVYGEGDSERVTIIIQIHARPIAHTMFYVCTIHGQVSFVRFDHYIWFIGLFYLRTFKNYNCNLR